MKLSITDISIIVIKNMTYYDVIRIIIVSDFL